MCWYPGEEGGTAISEILFGDVNPSGKLAVSMPRSSAQLPVYYNYKDQGRALTYLDMSATPLYPFGYGLSYTTFELKNVRILHDELSISELQNGKCIAIEIDLENTGIRAGAEVVQLYIHDVEATVTRRRKELKGFKKKSHFSQER